MTTPLDAELKVGTYDGGAHIGRSYVHFDTSALAGASVQRAELHLAERHSWNCGYWPEPVYRVTQGWDGRTMRDFPGAAVDPNWVGGTWNPGPCGARDAQWNVTGIASYWASVKEPKGSLSLRATNEGDNNRYKKYASTEAGAPPRLDVWYTNSPPAVPYNVTPAHGSVFGSPYTSVSAVYSDPDGGPGALAFGVWNYQNQLVWSQWSAQLCSGCGAAFNVPALPDNWYYVMVIGHDGVQYSSAWSAQQWFFVDTLPPSVSEVTPANGASGGSPAQVSARYSEPYGFTGTVYFWLRTTAGASILEASPVPGGNGVVAAKAIPTLGPGTYNLWAMASDGRQNGAVVGPNTFTVVGPTTTTTAPPTTTTTSTTTTQPPSTTTTVPPTTTTTQPPSTTTTVPPTTTTTTVPPLDLPTLVKAKKGVGSATVTWEPPTGTVTRYAIEVSGGCPSCGGLMPPADARSTIVTGLIDGTSYAFVVVAYNDPRSQVTRSIPSNAVIPGPPDYIALGDSYSAGEGTYDEEVPCNRSPHAYGPVYATELAPDPKPDVHFFACTGERIQGLLDSQVPLISSYEADLVTVTIGGNDAGFAEIIRHCVDPLPLPTHCDQDYPNGQRDIEALSGRLADVYNAILDRAPDATVVVLTYPQIFAAGPAPLDCPIYRDADENERTWIRARTADMDRVIRDTVDQVRLARNTNRLTALSVLDSFVGHDMCADQPYANAGVVTEPDDSFHPTAAGYHRMAEDLAAHLGGWCEVAVGEHRCPRHGGPRTFLRRLVAG